MMRNIYVVYIHLAVYTSGDVDYAKSQCPASLLQLLYVVELGLLSLKVKETTLIFGKGLKVRLQNANTPCHLVGTLEHTRCEPWQFNVNNLPSRQRITEAEEVVSKLDELAVRTGILGKFSGDLDAAIIPNVEKGKTFV